MSLYGGLCHAADFDQMWSKKCPLSEDFCHAADILPNVVQNVPLIGGLCHTADFDQMWPKMCPSSEDFVTLRTLTKCGPKICPLLENFVMLRISTKCGPKYAPLQRTLSHCGLYSVMVQHMPRLKKNDNHVQEEGINQWYPVSMISIAVMKTENRRIVFMLLIPKW